MTLAVLLSVFAFVALISLAQPASVAQADPSLDADVVVDGIPVCSVDTFTDQGGTDQDLGFVDPDGCDGLAIAIGGDDDEADLAPALSGGATGTATDDLFCSGDFHVCTSRPGVQAGVEIRRRTAGGLRTPRPQWTGRG
jgi:hypothetical protein